MNDELKEQAIIWSQWSFQIYQPHCIFADGGGGGLNANTRKKKAFKAIEENYFYKKPHRSK